MAAWLIAALSGLAGCSFYKGELLEQNETGASGSGTSGTSAGRGGNGGAGTGPCVPTAEVCNAIDDDCDGQIDDGASNACSEVILNADSSCVPFEESAVCVMMRCHDGFANCDGNPANGCEESFCTCNPCEDESADDAGADDGGAQDSGR